MTRILVAGGTGLLGCTAVPALREMGHRVCTLSRSSAADVQVDLLDEKRVMWAVKDRQPEIVIHLAAQTDVDRCEADPQSGFEGNVLSVQNMSAAVRAQSPQPHLIYLSTDHVYDGDKSGRMQAENEVRIVNHYAMSKYAGELAALRSSCTVLRTNFFGLSLCAGRSTFSDWLVARARLAVPTQIFSDVWFNALRMRTMNRALDAVCQQRHHGVFNLGSRGMVSKAEFARALMLAMGLDTGHMRDGTVQGAALRAKRPGNMAMDVRRFENTFNFQLPTIEEEIIGLAQEYKHVDVANNALRY